MITQKVDKSLVSGSTTLLLLQRVVIMADGPVNGSSRRCRIVLNKSLNPMLR